jgi:O-antigen/teichoic acid export membrane protein
VIAKYLPKSKFAKNVLTLVTGAGVAQLIPILASPILTRIYSPQEFGIFALYVAVISLLATVIAGRYELAIIVPLEDYKAVNLLACAILLSLLIGTLASFFIYTITDKIIYLLQVDEIASWEWMYLAPASAALVGINQSLYCWANRRQLYRGLAANRTLQSILIISLQISFSLKLNLSAGLVYGYFCGQVISLAVFIVILWSTEIKMSKKVSYKLMRDVAIEFIRFPQYLIVSHSINSATLQIPVFFLSTIFGPAIAGLYLITQRVIGAPSYIISSAISDVFRQQASVLYAQNKACKVLYKSVLLKLIYISVLPSAILVVFLPDLFALIFGDEWRSSGELAQILLPMYVCRFISTPVSALFLIANKQGFDLLWQLGLFALVSASFFVGSYSGNFYTPMILFSTSCALMYCVNIIFSYRIACGNRGVM